MGNLFIYFLSSLIKHDLLQAEMSLLINLYSIGIIISPQFSKKNGKNVRRIQDVQKSYNFKQKYLQVSIVSSNESLWKEI